MAKMSMINREIKRQKLVKQFTSKRLELKKIVKIEIYQWKKGLKLKSSWQNCLRIHHLQDYIIGVKYW